MQDLFAEQNADKSNSACRDFSGLDTLTANRVLRRLRDRGLLAKQGGGKATYYTLSIPAVSSLQTALPGMEAAKPLGEPSMPGLEGCRPSLAGLPGHDPLETLLAFLPEDLAVQTRAQRSQRQPRDVLRALLFKLCECRPWTAEELETLLGKHRKYLMTEHIRPLVQAGKLKLRYPESTRHPHQAYVAGVDEDKNND